MNRNILRNIPLEAIIWSGGLICLAIIDPHGNHLSICPFQTLGLGFCPGCGLGSAISHLFHGNLAESWHAHPLGSFAIIVLILRILQLTKLYIHSYGQNY